MRASLFLLLLLVSSQVFSQTKAILKSKITLKGKDTTMYSVYDVEGNCTFRKDVFSDGLLLVMGASYKQNEQQNYIYAASKGGLSINEFEYDAIRNTKVTFSYVETIVEEPVKDLARCNSYGDIIGLPEYAKEHAMENRFVSKVEYFKDTFLLREVYFNPNKDTIEVFVYTYENKVLKSIYHDDRIGDATSWTEFDYDAYGNTTEIRLLNKMKKVERVTVNRYEKKRLVKSTTFNCPINYFYKKDKLIRIESYTNYGKLRYSRDFVYRKNGLLDREIEVNNKLNEIYTTYYIY